MAIKVRSEENVRKDILAAHKADEGGFKSYKAVTQDNNILWTAYCLECDEALDCAPNDRMVEAMGAIHIKATGHRVLIGYEIEIKS